MIQKLATLLLLACAASAFAATSGVVFAPDGTPVAGARIAMYRPEPLEAHKARLLAGTARVPLASTTTDDDGAFSLDASSMSGVMELIAEGEGWGPQRELAVAGEDVVMQMQQAARRTGRVTHAGKAVPNARVIGFDDGYAVFETKTDARGEYSIPDPSRWGGSIAVIHPDFALHLPEDENAGAKLDVALLPGERVRGTVVTAKGAPAAHARLFVNGWQIGTADADGKFDLPHLSPSVTAIEAVAGGARGRAPRMPAGTAIRLGEPRSIAGSVRTSDKRALAGAGIVAWSQSGSSANTVADEKGHFTLEGLAPADYQVFANATASFQFDSARVSLGSSASARADLVAKEMSFVRGTVLDERKRPVAGATVQVSVPQIPPMYAFVTAQQMPTTKTRKDGTFRLPWNTPASAHATRQQVRLQASHPRFAIGVSEAMDPASMAAKPLTLVLPDGVELAGKVVDHDGKPVAGAGIVALEDPFGAVPLPLETLLVAKQAAPFVESGADGTFSLHVNEKPHDIAVWKESYAGARRGSVLPDGKPLEIVLERGAEIRGRVVKKGVGKLPEGMLVASSEEGAFHTTDLGTDGTFTFTGLRPGRYTVTFQTLRGEGPEKEVTAPAQDVRLEFAASGQVTGRVLDETTGEPVMATYTVRHSAEDYASDHFEAGEPFSIDVPPGTLTLIAQASGYRPQSLQATVEDGKSVELTFKLSRGRSITGRVHDESGAPLGGIYIQVDSDEETFDFERHETAEDGTFTLTGFPTSPVTLSFSGERHVRTDVAVAEGMNDPRLDVTLARGLEIKGRVVTAEGAPVEQAQVYGQSQTGESSRSMTTNEGGAFTLEGIGPGTYKLYVSRDDLERVEVENIEAGATNVVITMKPGRGAGAVHGKVSGFTGGKWQYGMVTAGERGTMAMIGRDGTFRLDKLPAGEVELQAMLNAVDGTSSTTAKTKATVIAGGDVEVNLAIRDDIVIRGVVTQDGQPAGGRVVRFYSDDGQWAARTSESGAYEASGLVPGAYSVTVDGRTSRGFSTRFTVTASATFDIAIDLLEITGKVVDVQGAPIAGAEIGAARIEERHNTESAKTDAAGTFKLSVPRGSYMLTAARHGYTAASRRVDGPTPVVITLHNGDMLPVRLVDARTNRPLTGYVVAEDGAGVVFRPTQAKDGVHHLPLAPGGYRVSASSEGFASQSVRVNVPSKADVRILLTPGGKLIIASERNAAELVKLVRADGEEYVQCHCNGIAEIRLAGASTVVEHVAPGTYTMQVFDERGRVKASYPVTIIEGQTTTADIHVPE